MSSTNGDGLKMAILYARVSTSEQARSGYSLAQQLEALRVYAAREGYEILEEVQETPDRAVRPSSGPAWTRCETWFLVEACRWCWRRTGTGSPGNRPTTTCLRKSSRIAAVRCEH